jgi:hypothetical protein
LGKVFHEIVMNLRPRIVLADDEAAATEIVPPDLVSSCQVIVRGHDHEDALAPQVRAVASLGARPSGQESDVELEPLEPRNMRRSPALNDIYADTGVSPRIDAEQFREKAACQG